MVSAMDGGCERRRRGPVAAGATAVLILTACGGRTSDPVGPRPLLAEGYSEERLLTREVVLDELALDLRRADAVGQLRTSGLDHAVEGQGLRIRPHGRDPQLTFRRSDLPFNRLEIEMTSAADGRLEVFWAPEGESFDAGRVEGTAVRSSPDPRVYVVDLWNQIRPWSAGYRLRIDPIDGPLEVTIHSIRLLRIARLPAPSDEPLFGKVSFGGETRAAVAVRPGVALETVVDVTSDAVLSFSTALAQEPGGEATLEVEARRWLGKRRLYERRFGPGEGAGWRAARVSLEGLSPGRWRLRFSVGAEPDADGDLVAGLVAGPRILHRTVSPRRPNVLLVSLDTLGAASLRPGDDGSAPAPFLAELAAEGTAFTNAFANASVTHLSHASLLTGREPLGTGLGWLGGRLRAEAAVAEAFRRAGYATAAFTGGVLVTEALGFDQGFERFYEHDTLHNRWSHQTDIDALADRLGGWLAERGPSEPPAFVFLHAYEVHGPFRRRDDVLRLGGEAASSPLAREAYLSLVHMKGRLPAPIGELGPWIRRLAPDGSAAGLNGLEPSPADLEVGRAYHRSEISHADRTLRSLFGRLEATGFLEDAIVVVTSDHGEAFGEHGLLEHGLLYAENLHVPLLLWSPGRVPAGQRLSAQVSSVDVAPTLLELAGLPAPAATEGRSLVPWLRGETSEHREFGVFVPGNGLAWYAKDRRKLALRAALAQENFGVVELFDLDADPGETRNLWHGADTLPDEWQERVRATVDRLPGLHVLVGELPAGDYDIEFDGVARPSDALYGFWLARLASEPPTSSGYRCRVRVGSESRLVLLGEAARRPVVLSILGTGEAQPWTFTVDPAIAKAGASHIMDEGGERALPVRWVEGYVRRGEGLPAKDRERLEDLGYLQ